MQILDTLNNSHSRTTIHYFLVSNLLVLAAVAYAAILESHFPDLYNLSIQEDEYLEWATFWAFLLAASINVNAAQHYRNAIHRFPWFLIGLSLFCFLVAVVLEPACWSVAVQLQPLACCWSFLSDLCRVY